MTARRLQINPEPLRVVPGAERDVWTRHVLEWRCHHEDGRGRCRSRETVMVKAAGSVYDVEAYCSRHLPTGIVA